MLLHISSPSECKDLQVAWVELNSAVGNFVIQRGHAPMIITLAPNSVLTYRLLTGKQELYKVVKGVAHVTRTGVTLIVIQ